MAEDAGAKVPRLRRKLTVEQPDDVSSPSTPTKKRGGRLAAKPQLDQIDENDQVKSPKKRGRKSIVKEDAEEKPVTPSRRSTRIKSNTSIVSETLTTDSPRAKRAARRSSIAGSDTEAPLTPARQTRKARRDSASNIDNQEPTTVHRPLQVTKMVIDEEPENDAEKPKRTSKSPETVEELSPNSARKSKRLLEKRNRRSGSHKSDCSTCSVENKSLNVSKQEQGDMTTVDQALSSESTKTDEKLSKSNINLLETLDAQSEKRTLNHNKSASNLDTEKIEKKERNRTVSWPLAAVALPNDKIVFSDNEEAKKKKSGNRKSSTKNSEAAPSSTTTKEVTDTVENKNDSSQTYLNTLPKKKKRHSESSLVKDTEKSSLDIELNETQTPHETNTPVTETITEKSRKSNITHEIETLFEKSPGNIQATVYFEDSNSSGVNTETTNKNERLDSEDQCVPVIKHHTEFQDNSSKPSDLVTNDQIIFSSQLVVANESSNQSKEANGDVNDSCEPMDIDETIHEELEKSQIILQESYSREKSITQEINNTQTESNKSKRKSSNSSTDTPNRSKNEIKSTLKLSQIKDTSATSEIKEDILKSPKLKTTEVLSQSSNINNTQTESNKSKRKSSNSSTDTPNRSKNENKSTLILSQLKDTSATSENKEDILKSPKLKTTEVLSQSSNINNTQTESNKSKRKSSNSSTDTPNRSKNENKSTLILSQLKDTSATSENKEDILKSPKLKTTEILSQSSNVVNLSKNKISKANVSLNDLKETPLKQRNVQKLTMQTSTPITSLQTKSEMEVDDKKSSPGKTNSDLSQFSDDDSEDEESFRQKSQFLDDEAEEASDNYESGDSQDDEDRQYNDENEIVEQGVTLESEDEDSDDTDYEKDSFVVSSDAEDSELLSGTGDDLSTTDNELTMSKKSKKKYNERKVKEQKSASREMFESRHKLNNSKEKSPAPKTRNNRMRIDSSLIESDEEVVVKVKKNKRLRLNSSVSSVKNDDNVESPDQKSNKSIQGSVSNESINEKEITICNESHDSKDPLQVQVKQEPKTPQKELDISVLQFTDRQDIENVDVEDKTILNQTEADPLEATMGREDDSDSSESEEILQNYDSMLNELSKNKQNKFNNHNVSLNTEKKAPKTKKAPIIDQLNLTHTKKPKKNKTEATKNIDANRPEPSKIQQADEGSCNSIDLKLLFSEDNSGSGDESISNRNQQDDEIFVPIRESAGKTNITENIDFNKSRDDSLNNSTNKKKKRTSSLQTTEVHQDTTVPEESAELNKSSSKKKKQRSSVSVTESTDATTGLRDVSQPDISETKKSSSKKQKQRSLSGTESVEEIHDMDKSVCDLLNGSNSKKHKTSVADKPQDIPAEELIVNESMKKKKKRKSSLPSEELEPFAGDLFFIDTTGTLSSEKDDHAKVDNTPVQVLYSSEKKKHKKNTLVNDIETEKPVPESQEKKKKKKKNIKNYDNSDTRDDDSDGAPEESPYLSEKAANVETRQETNENNAEPAETDSSKKKKKKKKKKSLDRSAQSNGNANNTDNDGSSSKKRKRSSSDPGVAQESAIEGTQNDADSSLGSHKKKPKISHNDEANILNGTEAINEADDSKQAKKRKKKKNRDEVFQNNELEPENTDMQVRKSKKRKERDEDNDSKKTKSSKESTSQRVHMKYLPESILSQLDDKPRKVVETPKVISTSNFIVENARQKRAKPSNYLEESIYLDAESPVPKKEKPRIKQPKVLPFVPTAAISETGFTTNFKINKLSKNIQFLAEPAVVTFSKEQYLQKKDIKRLGTYDRYKKQINKKMSKF